MKNRELIKQAIIFFLRETSREKMNKAHSKKDEKYFEEEINAFLDENRETFDNNSEHILDEYDKYLIETLAISLSDKLKERVKNENEYISRIFQEVLGVISSNHLQVSESLLRMSVFNRLIRLNILSEEIDHIEQDYKLLEQHKKALKKLASKEVRKISLLFCLVMFMSIVIWGGLISHFNWDIMEKWIYMSGLVLMFLNVVYYLIFERDLTRESIRNEKIKKATEHIHNLYKFDEKQIDRCKELLITKRSEVSQIREELQKINSE